MLPSISAGSVWFSLLRTTETGETPVPFIPFCRRTIRVVSESPSLATVIFNEDGKKVKTMVGAIEWDSKQMIKKLKAL
jgi:hypothetical protein